MSLLHIRNRLNASQVDVAHAAGVHQSTISRLEGGAIPAADVLVAVARGLRKIAKVQGVTLKLRVRDIWSPGPKERL